MYRRYSASFSNALHRCTPSSFAPAHEPAPEKRQEASVPLPLGHRRHGAAVLLTPLHHQCFCLPVRQAVRCTAVKQRSLHASLKNLAFPPKPFGTTSWQGGDTSLLAEAAQTPGTRFPGGRLVWYNGLRACCDVRHRSQRAARSAHPPPACAAMHRTQRSVAPQPSKVEGSGFACAVQVSGGQSGGVK